VLLARSAWRISSRTPNPFRLSLSPPFDAGRAGKVRSSGRCLIARWRSALEQQPLQRLAAEGELVAYRHVGFWQPMDTPREFALLNTMWDSGSAPWKVW